MKHELNNISSEGDGNRYRICADWMQARYGSAPQRIPLDLGGGCPREGGRCTFCAEDGARAQQLGDAVTLEEQFEKARRFAVSRYDAKCFMVYFQAHTPLWRADEERWQAMELCMAQPGVVAVSVGVRPDGLSDEALERLAGWRNKMDVWLELGVQTTHDRTLRHVRRGHDWGSSRDAIIKLHELGFLVGAHLILGLPGETPQDICTTAERIGELPVDGVKLHHLQVLRGTPLADEYERNPFPVMGPSEYADRAIDVLRRLSSRTVVLRLTADSPDENCVAPQWKSGKGPFLNYLNDEMIARDVAQGDLHPAGALPVALDDPAVTFLQTEDGSTSYQSHEFKEYAHAAIGARLEGRLKYVIPGKLKERLRDGAVRILDIGFGLGANTREALECAASVSGACITVDAVERNCALTVAASSKVHSADTDLLEWPPLLKQLVSERSIERDGLSVKLHFCDVRAFVRCAQPELYDLIFLDAFSPPRCPQLWSLEFIRILSRILKPGGALLTYCAARAVRAALLQAGLSIGDTAPIGRDRPGTIAVHDENLIEIPLAADELEAITSTSSFIPYRDPDLIDGRKAIQRRRQVEMTRS